MIKVSELRKKGKNYLVIIKLDTEEKEYLVSEDIIIEYRLLTGKELLENQYKKLLNEINKDEIYQKLLRFALFKPRTKKEIFAYLDNLKVEEYGYFLAKLEKLKLLDDEKYAENYVSESINFKKIGPRKINEDLKLKGISEPLIRKYLDTHPKGSHLKNIEYWFEKKLKAIKNKPYLVVKKNLLTAIVNKGFDYEDVINFLDSKVKILNDTKSEAESLKKDATRLKEQYGKKDIKTPLNQYLIKKLLAKGYQYNSVKKYLEGSH